MLRATVLRVYEYGSRAATVYILTAVAVTLTFPKTDSRRHSVVCAYSMILSLDVATVTSPHRARK